MPFRAKTVRCIDCGYLATEWGANPIGTESERAPKLVEIHLYERRGQQYQYVWCFLNAQDLMREQIVDHNPPPNVAARLRRCEFFFKQRPHHCRDCFR
jgi:hypothetical protein